MAMFRWGLIGAGDIVQKRVAAALRDTTGSELTAVCRARSELAESFAAAAGATRWYADWRTLLDDRDIDGVYIATPVHLHAEQTIAAAERGKHVLCEKPMALDAGACEAMIAACRANGVTLGIAYYRRFYPAVLRAKAILASGEIGRPVVAHINAFERFNPAPDHPRHWFVEAAQSGGGPMMDFGCHRLEIFINLFGHVADVKGTTAKVVFDRQVEDTAVATLQFESGPCATVTVTHAAMEPQDTLDIFATDGSLHVGKLNAGDLRIVTANGERVEQHPPAPNLHAPLVADFVEAVSRRRSPAVTGEIGLAVARLEDAIYGRDAVTSAR
jgi:predicted dehydrogenase